MFSLCFPKNANKMATKTFANDTYRKISLCMMLDTRHRRFVPSVAKAEKLKDEPAVITKARKSILKNAKSESLPVVVRITKERKSIYIKADVDMTEKEFEVVCSKSSAQKVVTMKNKLQKTFDLIKTTVHNLVDADSFTFDEFKRKFYNLKRPDEINLYKLWRNVADNKSAGTKSSYMDAYKRFAKDMGGKVRFEDIGRTFVSDWQKKMEDNGLSKTTANIYLRAFRVVLNEAASQELIKTDTKALFKKMAIGGKNSYNSRKHEYLDVPTWRKLWAFYEAEGEGNEIYQSWRSDYKRDRMNALGMMLFMYLADGMNLRDVINLRYDDFYFSHNREQFRFVRQKVAKRTDAEVVFPVLPQMRTILNRQALPEERGGLVFGYLLGKAGKIDDEEERRLTALCNSVIRERMKSVAKAVGLDVEPTPTWCRHSFASNLIQCGVPKDYISQSMGHSSGTTITDNYIDRYSYAQMVDYNSRLLADPQARSMEQLKELLKGLTLEEIMTLKNQ